MDYTDQQLVAQCKQHLPYDTTAFELLLRRYEPVVFRTCQRYLRNDQDAEEACQDAFLRVFHSLPNFAERSAFRTWLFRIVSNACSTVWAKRKRRREQSAAYAVAMRYEVAADYEPQAGDFNEVTGVVGDGLDALSVEDRQILILRHVSELSFEEIAGTLDVGLSAAKMRLYRAEQRLRIAYEAADVT